MQINAITTMGDWTHFSGAWSDEGVSRIIIGPACFVHIVRCKEDNSKRESAVIL